MCVFCYCGVHITFVQLHVQLCVHACRGGGVLSITIHLVHRGRVPHFISELADASHLSSLLSPRTLCLSVSSRPWGSGGSSHLSGLYVGFEDLASLPALVWCAGNSPPFEQTTS